MYDGLPYSAFAMWAFVAVGTFDSVEDDVQGDVTGPKLDEETSLVASELVGDMEKVIRGEGGIDLPSGREAWGG